LPDLTIDLLFAIAEDGPLGISATGSQAIEVGAHMRSTEALEIVTIVEHRRLLIPLTRMAWALYLRDVLAHVVWPHTTTALQLSLLGVGKDKVRFPGLVAMVSLAIVFPAWMSRAATLVGSLVIVHEWPPFIIACLILA